MLRGRGVSMRGMFDPNKVQKWARVKCDRNTRILSRVDSAGVLSAYPSGFGACQLLLAKPGCPRRAAGLPCWALREHPILSRVLMGRSEPKEKAHAYPFLQRRGGDDTHSC